MPSDNGFLNSTFLHRCRPIGYRHPKEIVAHYRDPYVLCENASGELLEYWKLCSSEQDRATELALFKAGYLHSVALPMPSGPEQLHVDRLAMQTALDNGQKFKHWTHFYKDADWESVFYFKSETDAVQFRLTVP